MSDIIKEIKAAVEKYQGELQGIWGDYSENQMTEFFDALLKLAKFGAIIATKHLESGKYGEELGSIAEDFGLIVLFDNSGRDRGFLVSIKEAVDELLR